MKYTFKLIVQPDEGMGLDDACDIQDAVEELIRDSGIDNGASFKLVFEKQEDESCTS